MSEVQLVEPPERGSSKRWRLASGSCTSSNRLRSSLDARSGPLDAGLIGGSCAVVVGVPGSAHHP